MPLFGNKNDDPAYNNGTTTGTGHHGHTGPGPVMGGAAGGLAGHEAGHPTAGTALGAAAGHHHANTHPDYNATTGTTGTYDATGTGTGVHGHHGHTGPGTATGGAAGGVAGHELGHTGAGAALGAAAGHHHANTHPDNTAYGTHGTGAGTTGTGAGAGTAGNTAGGAGAGAGEKAFVGKLERAAGTALCSSTLKAKGLEKEREAQALKVQAAELGQAEGLESEAAARRERAVNHGAHPQHLNKPVAPGAIGGGNGTVGGGVAGRV